jgi:hypothetical protein
MRNEISLPAPGPLGNITVTGLVGCQASATVGAKIKAASIFLIDIEFLK